MALQADGKIVVAGRASNGSNDDFAVVRYTAAGTADEVAAYLKFPLGLAVVVALGMVWEDQAFQNVFFQWSDMLLPAIFGDRGGGWVRRVLAWPVLALAVPMPLLMLHDVGRYLAIARREKSTPSTSRTRW